MSLKIKDITFVIVSYKSESTLYDCLDSLPNETKKIIVENSNNINLKKDLINKYDNIEVILSKNIGMGAGNNIGLKACTTDYAFVLNPDAILNKDTLVNLIAGLNEVKDFTLASPVNDNPNFPNFKTTCPNLKNVNVLPVTRIDGFSMFFNKFLMANVSTTFWYELVVSCRAPFIKTKVLRDREFYRIQMSTWAALDIPEDVKDAIHMHLAHVRNYSKYNIRSPWYKVLLNPLSLRRRFLLKRSIKSLESSLLD